MTNFDFKSHLEKYDLVQNNLERLFLDKALFDYYDSLSKAEQAQFKQELNNFLHNESKKIRQELNEIALEV
jgi:hypothetical protein